MGLGSANINIGTAVAGTSPINIGTSAFSTINMNGPTINIGSNQLLSTDIINIGNITGGLAGMNLGAKTINIGNISTSIQIGNYMAAGGAGINIGNSAISTAIDGATLNVGRYATALNMGTSMTTGNNINIGNSVVTTNLNGQTINMGYGMVAGSNINIGNNVITTNLIGQTVNIGTIANAGGTTVNIGNSGTSYIYANASLYLNNGSFLYVSGLNSYIASQYSVQTPAITSFNGTTDCTVYSALTSGKINLGPANITSAIVSKCPHTFNNGIGFLNSNVVRDKIMRGRTTTTPAIPANSTVSQTHTFASSYIFGANPDVVATVNGGNAVILMSITTIQPGYFITLYRNTSGVAIVANAYAVSYIAMGSI